MAEDLTIKIKADVNDAANKIVSLLGDIGKELGYIRPSAEEATKAFQELGIKSTDELEKIRISAIKNYEMIKNSGTATPKDIANAHSAMTKIIESNSEQQVSFGNKLINSWKAVKAAWVEIAVIIASLNFLRKMAMSAIEAEEAASKLKFQIEGLGISFEKVKDSINEVTLATAKYARVQEEEVQGILQQLIFVTGDLQKSQESLNLVYDLAYQKGIGVGEAANIIAKGMTGNLEPLGRQFIEFRNLNEEMGKHVIQADKIAIFQAFMTERVKGSIKEMSVQKQIIQGFGKYWADWAQFWGGAALFAIRWVDDVTVGYEHALEIAQKLGKIAYASVGDQFTMIVNEKSLLAIKELILEETKDKEISEKETEKIINDVTEAYKKEATIVKKNMEERKAGEKRISDLIDSRIKSGVKATEGEKKAIEEKKKMTEDFYKDLEAKQIKVESEILKRRIESDIDYIKKLKERLAGATKEYDAFKGEVLRIEGEIVRAREEGKAGREKIRTSGMPQADLDKEQAVKISADIKSATKTLAGYDIELGKTDIHLSQIRSQLETGIKFDSEGNIKNAAADIESLKKSLDPQKFAATATALSDAADAIQAEDYSGAAKIITEAQKALKLDTWKDLLEKLSDSDKKVVDIGTHANDDSITFDGTTTKIKAWGIATSTEIETLRVKILSNIAEIARDHETKSKTGIANLETELSTAETHVKTLVDMDKKMEFEILVKGYEEALTKKAELEKPTSSTHTIYTAYSGQGAPRGSSEALDEELRQAFQGLSKGGDIQPLKAAGGRHFAGFGGGDRIPILGEAGEFMSDKNTVRFWSPKMFEILKMKDSGALLSYLGANKMAQGGMSSGTTDKLSVDLNLGGKTFPMNTTKNTGVDFAKQIRQLNVLRGRYKQPY